MAYKHGVYTNEVASSIIPSVSTEAAVPVIFGTAPLHLATDAAKVNYPVLCSTYAEAVAAFGYSDDWESYTLCEAIYTMFALYGVSPIILVNVLDPDEHKTSVSNAEVTITDGEATITDPVILDTLVVMSETDGNALTSGTDYEAAYNDDGELIITVLDDGALADATTCYISYDALDPTAVTSDDIIGGVSTTTGEYKGLEVLDNVYPITGQVPGAIAAPGWADDPEVVSVMKTKCTGINEHFQCIAIADIPTDEVTKYTDVYSWKNDNNFVDENLVVCWPMVQNGDTIYHLSTHVLGVMGTVDADNDDIPYESPSNKSVEITGACLEDGTEVVLGNVQANLLNSYGIVTVSNFNGGWVLWGNRTSAYPSNTDVKDSFICSRRMIAYMSKTFILTYWAKVDKPITKRLIQTIVDSENIRINGLVAAGALLGGELQFNEDDNPTTDLMDGIIQFHLMLGLTSPARDIECDIEYDPSYFSTLWESE